MSEVMLYASANNRQIKKGGADWDTPHDAASGDEILDNYETPYWLVGGGARLVATYSIYRGYLTFDASAYIGATINTITLDIYPKTVYQTSSEAYPNIQITEGVQSSPVTLANYGDQLAYTTVWGEARYDSLVIDQYSPITFGSTGITAVQAILNSDGIIKLCIRAELDVADQVPPLGTNWSQFHSAQKGGDYRPRLTLGYTQAVYPTESITRVTSLIHRYDRGVYNLIAGLGEVTADFGVPEIDPGKEGRKSYEPKVERFAPVKVGRGVPTEPVEPPKVGRFEPTKVGRVELEPKVGRVVPPEEPSILKAGRGVPTPTPVEEPRRPAREPVPLYDIPLLMKPAVTTTQRLWRGITPWEEEAGETFPSAVGDLWRKLFG